VTCAALPDCAPARRHHSQRAGTERHTGNHTHWRRQIPLLSVVGVASGRYDARRIAAHRLEEGSGGQAGDCGYRLYVGEQHVAQPRRARGVATHRHGQERHRLCQARTAGTARVHEGITGERRSERGTGCDRRSALRVAMGSRLPAAFLEIANAVKALGQPSVLALTATATAPLLEGHRTFAGTARSTRGPHGYIA
jgi:hypothetical protein